MAAAAGGGFRPKFVAGATGTEEIDVGVGKKKYRWKFDGREFDWECFDDGEWYPLIGKKRFRQVFKMMRGEDGKSWGQPTMPKDFASANVKVWTRSPTIAGAKTNEIKLEGDIKGVKPEAFFNVLNEEHYRATWDNNMLKGYNIAKFSRNNDIGYYEASMPMISNRDFCNQRAWMELGDEHYIICNNSKPHSRCPTKKGVVRGLSYITAYYMRPCHTDPTATTVTYITCPDPGGWIPSAVINMVQTKKGPEAIINLGKAAMGLDEWLEKVYQEYENTGKQPVKGPWDKTLEFPNTFHPRPPKEQGYYRNKPMRLDEEAKQVAALVKEGDAALEALLAEEKKEFGEIKKEYNSVELPEGEATPGLARRSSARQHIKAVDSLAKAIEGNPEERAASLDKLHQLELAVKATEAEHLKVKERLAVFARTPGGDPFTRVPADEPAVCSDFRRRIANITTAVALELTEEGRVNEVTTVEYLYLVLNKLESEYLLPESRGSEARHCPNGHGRFPYDQLWRFAEYRERPDSSDVWIVKFVLYVMIACAVINFIVTIHAFREDYWEVGLLALAYIVIGDLTLWWVCRDIHYKDRPFRDGGKATPLLWPMRLQLIPVLPCQAVHLLLRVPKEIIKWDSTATHANVLFRFTFFYSFMRLLVHHAPLVYLFAVVQYRSSNHVEPSNPLMSFAFWMVFLVPNIAYTVWMLLWVARIFFSGPSPTSTKMNICGLPQFRRSFYLFLGVLLVLVAMGACSIPVLYDSDHYPADAPTPAPAPVPAS